ncbi:DUF4209 domain-containing protein [Geomonas sp. RF6]|nr:DUF4209 domain-containing protein [Geomonas sp. RF6]UFS72476.1 DUF4209 domain-containing protein [Geomonas sp. RF6]
MSNVLSAAARKAIEEGRTAEGKVLWLLADACSMALKPASLNQPFEPTIILLDRRSSAPEDFAKEDIAFFATIVDDIDHPWLQARIADVLWLLNVPRSPKHALIAIDAYRSSPLSLETRLAGTLSCWERALVLARMLGPGAANRLTELEDEFCSSVEKAVIGDGVFALDIVEVLDRHHLGRSHLMVLATKLESMAREAESEGHYLLARRYFDAATKWFLKAKEKQKAAELIARSAETFVHEANARLNSSSPSYIVAASFFEDAIQKLRHIPRSQRQPLKIDERIAEIHELLTDAGEKSIEEMRSVPTPPIDITDVTSASMAMVRGKDIIEALSALVNGPPAITKQRIQGAAKEVLKRSFLQSFFGGTQLSRDGRVIGKSPSSKSAGKSQDDALWVQMVKHHGLEINFLVHGCIWPALEALRLEHRVTEGAFIALASNSPIVPPGRADLFGKALFEGYDNDFIAALHLLVPQLENLVRWHLKTRGVKTTTLDADGIHTENGLSTLAWLPEMEEIFGEDFTFEIRALFCDPFGPNLRNEVAHGLFDSGACQSAYSVYAWWFALKIVLNIFLHQRRGVDEASEWTPPPPEDSPAGESPSG